MKFFPAGAISRNCHPPEKALSLLILDSTRLQRTFQADGD
jgi:hypothetical protein